MRRWRIEPTYPAMSPVRVLLDRQLFAMMQTMDKAEDLVSRARKPGDKVFLVSEDDYAEDVTRERARGRRKHWRQSLRED